MTQREINVIAITDCGSTTTKAILIEKIDGVFRKTARGDAPTTVEEPEQDITKGVLNALDGIASMRGRPLVKNNEIIRPCSDTSGVDLYLSTSSAGGGLQMMVAGVVRKLSARSAERAALGAGAIIADVIAFDDYRPLHEQMERIREIRPDMVLLAGGTDGGATTQVIEMAELLVAADPKPRFGDTYLMPVVYAGNAQIKKEIEQTLKNKCALHQVTNLLSTVDTENLEPARTQIHTLFLEHVMRQAPGFGNLSDITDDAVIPTPSAVGELLVSEASKRNESILCVDIGGATTDIFSVVEEKLNRTVSANLGMSYSATNVLMEAGVENVTRWLPFAIEEAALIDLIMNKTVRPTTIPDSQRELIIEQALAREALRLSLTHHLDFTRPADTGGALDLTDNDSHSLDVPVTMDKIDFIIGSGGAVSHAPEQSQAALMVIDGFLPEGVTQIAKDAIFMMPHLGVLSRTHPEIAHEVFDNDCLENLCTCIAPYGKYPVGQPCLDYEFTFSNNSVKKGTLLTGELSQIPLGTGESAAVVLSPRRGLNIGNGPGKPWRGSIEGGDVGIVLDGRGRPLLWPDNKSEKMQKAASWLQSMGASGDEE